MKIELIEQLGGYGNAKCELELKEQNSVFQCCIAVDAEMIRDALLQYRRQHNIFEVGDLIVFDITKPFCRLMQPDLMKILNPKYQEHDMIVRIDNQTYVVGGKAVRHAEPEEIQACRRLDQIKCWSCDKIFTTKQLSENDGFCVHCNSEVCGG